MHVYFRGYLLLQAFTTQFEAVGELEIASTSAKFGDKTRLNEIFPQLRRLTLIVLLGPGSDGSINSEFYHWEHFTLNQPFAYTTDANIQNCVLWPCVSVLLVRS